MQNYSVASEDAPGVLATPIIQVVELVRHLQDERRQPSRQEEEVLANWMGWATVAPAFETYPKGKWAEIGARLQMLLGPDRSKAASAATTTSFFTDRMLTSVLWEIARQLGFDGGHVLDPGCGSGSLLAGAPLGLPLEMTGIERDPFSSEIARLRLPNASILTMPLEKIALPNNSFDLVIGNVPFSDVFISDRQVRHFSLHNYFVMRSLLALRPGGVAILITSSYTLDAQRDGQRVRLGEYANLLGALRLPSGAFAAAGTQVVADILVLQRRSALNTWKGQPWMDLSMARESNVRMNEYFSSHPQHIIGVPRFIRRGFRDDELDVIPPEDYSGALARAIEDLVGTALSHDAHYLPPKNYAVIDAAPPRRVDGRKEGSYHCIEGQLVQVIEGECRPVLRHVAELLKLVELRDAITFLLEAERDLARSESDLAEPRQRLNSCYDAYVRAFGTLHRFTFARGKIDSLTGGEPTSGGVHLLS